MLYAQTRVCPGEWDARNSLGIWDTNRSPNPSQMNIPCDSWQERGNLPKSGLCRPNGQLSKNQRKRRKRGKYLDLARERRKLWNMRVTVVPVVIVVLRTIPKDLIRGLEELEIGGRAETIQTTTLQRSARILSRIL